MNWGPFDEKKIQKVPQSHKNEKGDPLGFFNIHAVAKFQKKLKGEPLGIFFEKSRTMPKKLKGADPLVWPGIVCYAEKGKTFLVQFLRPTGTI